ncbi:MAG: hypothetical protein HYT22_02670 [Candidatus Niyogibacteria bacterium]|nr:hypothetical protein [Candidatus Niyogibacteria bacterium]
MIERKLPTGTLMRAFDSYAQTFRGERPVFIRFKDGKLIKHALTYLTEFELEMLFVWFLREKKDMRPTIGAALCKEVIADFIRASGRTYGFYLQLENSIRQLSRGFNAGGRLSGAATSQIWSDEARITGAFEKLKGSYSRSSIRENPKGSP